MGIFVLPDKNYVQGGLNKKMGILQQYCMGLEGSVQFHKLIPHVQIVCTVYIYVY